MMIALLGALLFAQPAPPIYAVPGEIPVAPYAASPANVGATPFAGPAMAATFGGQRGIHRLIDRTLDLAYVDPVIGEIFQGQDRVRLGRTLFEQFCTILAAGCAYSGRDMASAHKDLGIQRGDLNRFVELLQRAMREQRISFAAQNRLLARLVPMKSDVVTR